MSEPQVQTVTYYGYSILLSKTFWFGVATILLGIASLPDVYGLIPAKYLPAFVSIIGFLTIAFRKLTVRPVALVLPSEVVPIDVPKIGPPPPTMAA
jgi:hypothetical protein